MSTSRTVRRRKQSEERRRRRDGQAREQALAATPRTTRVADALAAAHSLIAAEFPELHERGFRLQWEETDEFRCPGCGLRDEEIPVGHAWSYQRGGSCQQPPKLTREELNALWPGIGAILDTPRPDDEEDEEESEESDGPPRL